MITDPISPGLHPLSQLKAGPTTSSSRSTASPTTVPHPQLSHRPQLSKNPNRDEQVNTTGEKATIALIRRVLCPQTGSYGGATSPYLPEEVLPPLTSSNELDHELYALIAIVIKEFVFSWYSKITPDQDLVNEALQVIAHCTRALEQRLRGADVAQLVLDEVPALVEAHIAWYRLAKEQSSLSGFSPSSREIYHALNPHPGLSPVPDPSDAQVVAQQHENECVYRQLLVHGVLAVLLPTEDLENSCLRTLVGDILADLVLGKEVSGKMCKGWFLWGSITKLLDTLSSRDQEPKSSQRASQQSRLQTFGLISPKDGRSGHSPSSAQSQASKWVWQVLNYLYLLYVTLRFVVAGLFRVASTPKALSTSSSSPPVSLADEIPTTCSQIWQRPVLDYRLSGMLSQLLDIPKRMPWLGGLLALFQYLILAGPGKLGDAGSVLDRFLQETIQDYVLTPTLLPNLLLASREALFPQNARPKAMAGVNRIGLLTPHTSVQQLKPPTQKRPDSDATGINAAVGFPASPLLPDQGPSGPEVAAIRRQCAVAILSLIPRPIARRLLGISANRTGDIPVDDPQPLQGLDSRTQETSSLESSPASASPPPSRTPSRVPPITDGGDAAEDTLLIKTIENDILDLFADEYCNKHLIYSIIETILAKILPELSDRSTVELMEDRGVSIVPG